MEILSCDEDTMDLDQLPVKPVATFEFHTLLSRHLTGSTLFTPSAHELDLHITTPEWKPIPDDIAPVRSHPASRKDLTANETAFLARHFGDLTGIPTHGYPIPRRVTVPEGETVPCGYKVLYPFPVIKPQPVQPGGVPYAIVECGIGSNITYIVPWYDETHPCMFPGLSFVSDDPELAFSVLNEEGLERDMIRMLVGESPIYPRLEVLLLCLLRTGKAEVFVDTQDIAASLGPTGSLARAMALSVVIRDIILRVYSEECLTAAGVDITNLVPLSPRLAPVLEYMTRILLYWGGAGPMDRVRIRSVAATSPPTESLPRLPQGRIFDTTHGLPRIRESG